MINNEEKNFLSKTYPPVEAGSDDWKIIEFKLQLALGTSSVVVKQIYNVTTAHLHAQFSTHAKGSIIL